MNTAIDRLETAVRNIMSGDNACGTLANAAYNNDHDYFRRAIAPVVNAYEQEAADLRRQRDDILKDAEAKRYALEFIAQNLGGSVQIAEPAIVDAIRQALPGRTI